MKVAIQRIDSGGLVLRITFIVEMTLLTLVMSEHRDATAVFSLVPGEHDSLSTETSLHFQALVLLLDNPDDVTAHKHLGLSVAVFEELILRDLSFVVEQVDLIGIKTKLARKFPTERLVLTRAYMTDLKNFISFRCTVSLSTPLAYI